MKAQKFFSFLLLVVNVMAFVSADDAAKPVVTLAAPASAKTQVVVSVDVDKIVEAANEFKAKRQEVEDKLKVQAKPLEDIQKNAQEKQAALQKNGEKIAQGAKDMTDAAKKALEDENKKHQEDLMKLSQEHQAKAQDFQGKAESARQDFVKFVQERIKAVAKELGIDLVVFPGVSLVVNDACDYTQKILEKLDADYAKKQPAKKPAEAAKSTPVAFAKKK